MLKNNKNITVVIRLFSGLDKENKIMHYDSSKGIIVETKSGTSLKKILKSISMKKLSNNLYYMNTERISLREKILENTEISCFRASGGG